MVHLMWMLEILTSIACFCYSYANEWQSADQATYWVLVVLSLVEYVVSMYTYIRVAVPEHVFYMNHSSMPLSPLSPTKNKRKVTI